MTERFAARTLRVDSTLRNPYSRHEKGNVEAKVGAIRRALFVPVPKAYGYESFNRDLFERDRAAPLALPGEGFAPVDYRRMKSDKYGAVTLEGNHRYFAGIEHAGRELIVGFRADSVEILMVEGRPVGMHERAYVHAPTSSDDQVKQLEALVFPSQRAAQQQRGRGPVLRCPQVFITSSKDEIRPLHVNLRRAR